MAHAYTLSVPCYLSSDGKTLETFASDETACEATEADVACVSVSAA